MKKYILIFLSWIILSSFWAYAAASQDKLEPGILGDMCITTVTSEPCGFGENSGSVLSGSDQTARYSCRVCGAQGFIEFISQIYKFIFFISMIIGVLVIVALGLGMSLGGMADTEEIKTKAKYRIMSILWGLMAMALIPWILKTVAPFFFQ